MEVTCTVAGNSGTSANARRAVPQGQGTPGILAKSTMRYCPKGSSYSRIDVRGARVDRGVFVGFGNCDVGQPIMAAAAFRGGFRDRVAKRILLLQSRDFSDEQRSRLK